MHGRFATVLREYLAAYSGNTAHAYRRDLADWVRHCQTRRLDPMEATRADVTTYLDTMRSSGASSSTVARRLVALRGVYDLAVAEHGLPASPAARIRTPRRSQQTRLRALNTAEAARLMAAADAHSPVAAALVWVLITTGVRVSEACHLDIERLHRSSPGDQWADVTCKGGIDRSIILEDHTWTRIQTAVARRPQGPVLTTRTGARLDRRSAARLIDRLAATAGISGPVSPHVLRHTFVTLARSAGCDLATVQDAAGHADPATTRRYDRTVLGPTNHPATAVLTLLGHPAT